MSERRPYRRPMDPKWWWAPGALSRLHAARSSPASPSRSTAPCCSWACSALSSGPDAYAGFLGFLRSPISILLHIALLAAVVYHVKTWFETLPKTQPKIIVKGKQVPAQEITRIAHDGRGRLLGGPGYRCSMGSIR